MTVTKLPGHETCDYSPFDTAGINQAIEALDAWLSYVVPMLPQADREYGRLLDAEGKHSPNVQAAAGMLLSLTEDVKAAEETRACLMCEIMNRAYADDEKWNRNNPGFSDPLVRLL